MLKKEYRLNPLEIATIARRGKRISSEYFDIRVWWDNEISSPVFALAVGLKVSKKAVIRNNIKRKFRVAIHNLLMEKNFKKGKYLIIVKSDVLKDKSSQEITGLIRDIYI